MAMLLAEMPCFMSHDHLAIKGLKKIGEKGFFLVGLEEKAVKRMEKGLVLGVEFCLTEGHKKI